jgi:SAM-dependent methyltransferase
MTAPNYRAVWDRRSGDDDAALDAVDNSRGEAVARATGAWTADQLDHALAVDREDTLLELGCGAGRIGRELAPRCGRWIGVDISPNMIRVARRRLAHLDHARLEVLERSSLGLLDDASVDKAYTVAVLCHMDKEDLFLYLRELARVLKPGGLAYLETWNLADPTGWRRWMYEVEQWNRSDQDQRKDVARNQFCVPEELRLYAERAGFEPLALFRDSPWIQLVVGHDLDARRVERERERLAERRHRIAYSPLFGKLFGEAARVIYGERHPEEVLAELDALPPSPEIPLFRTYIQGLWSANPAAYGESPASPAVAATR